MVFSRRRALQAVGASISGTIVAGCLSTGDPGSSDDDEDDDPDGDGDDSPGDDHDPGGDGDADDLSIDGRLHNETSAAQSFEVTIRNENDEVVASDEWEVEAADSLTVPAFGRPGEPRTFEVTVEGAAATKTLTFDVDPMPERKEGYVDITYTTGGTVEIEFTQIDESTGSDELPRVDRPPYEISEPECGDDGDRDPLWLCENMDAEPSLGFDQVETSSSVFADEGLAFGDEEGAPQFYAVVLTDESDLDRVDRDAEGAAVELIERTDFDSEAVLVVQTGWGSGSITPHLKRIEETGDGIHAFGCYRRPCGGTSDYTMRTDVTRFERPDRLENGIVSLTLDPETRVTFEIGDGVVTVTDER